EIKRKNNKGRTSKKRTSIPLAELADFRQDGEACAYLAKHSAFEAGQIAPVLETLFQRITLVNAAKTERITVDTRLYFKNFRTGKETSLRNAVIIELKQDGRAASQMKGILLDHRVKPVRVSKYCVAVTLTDPSAKSNRFKVKVRAIEKIINHKINVA
ncbi:MAG: VTC domain-containing protein, partial [Bacteroidales bacterium]|nr:VTC domain-containing protein [Bacteroidales bacterium]